MVADYGVKSDHAFIVDLFVGKARRGAKKAILAVAASMLTAAYHMLSDGVEYTDLGPNYFDRHHAEKTIRRLLKRLADLGCQVVPMAHAV